jgi:hypothetical protein
MIDIKKIFLIIFIVFNIFISVEASTNENIKIIEATKNIKYLSQNIAREYLYLYHNPKRLETNIQLQNDIKELENNFRFVAKNTNSADSKNILDYLSYSKDQIKEILNSELKAENRELILDNTEALSEGAQSILISYNYDPLKDKDIKINLANISKFYMAIHENINPSSNKESMIEEIKIIDNKLIKSTSELKGSWRTLKTLLVAEEKQFIPNIISILIKNIENMTQI